MIKLKELSLSNFKSWISFTISDTHGILFIVGSNGSGKSSLRHAIEYLLTDSISDDIAVSDIPFNSGSNCSIKGVFQKDDDVIEIIKYRNDKSHGNKIVLKINDNDSLTHSDRRDTQREIETLFGITKNSLLASTIFSQKSLSFPDASDSERKEILFHSLDLNKYKEYELRAKEKIKDLNDKVDYLNNQTRLKESEKEFKDQRLIEIKSQFKSFEILRRKKIAEQLLKKEELKKRDKSNLEKNYLDLNDKVGDKTVDDLINKRYDLNDKLNIVKGDLNSIESSINKYNSEVLSLNDLKCPLMDNRCDLLDSYQQDNLPILKKNIDDLKEKRHLFVDKISIITDDIKQLEIKISNIKDLIKRRDDIKLEINSIIEYNNSIDFKIETIDSYIKELSEQSNPITKKHIEDLIEEVFAIDEDIFLLIAKRNNYRELLNYYKYWEVGYSRKGIPSMKTDSYLEKIENEINKNLSLISNDIFVSIDAQSELASGETREKISFNIYKTASGQSTSYNSLSSGEKQRIKLANLFAFATVIGKFSFIFLDEVLELSLDESGKAEIINLLKKKEKDFDSIFIISHDTQIINNFNNILKIKSVNGVSKCLQQ